MDDLEKERKTWESPILGQKFINNLIWFSPVMKNLSVEIVFNRPKFWKILKFIDFTGRNICLRFLILWPTPQNLVKPEKELKN
jgi:hypothetical protein